ncbi:MAG: ABC transporter ATP-binding protein, partial [Victivallales bacterium]|nr:ABC transporter ATP-binding protein [Victivallales bacterium]
MPDRQNSLTSLRLPPRYQAIVDRTKCRPAIGAVPHHHGPGANWRKPLEKAGSPWLCFRRILAMAKGRGLWIAIVLSLAALSSLASIIAPILMGKAIDSLRDIADNRSASLKPLLVIIALMASAYAFSSFLHFLQGWFSEKLAQDTLYEMRRRLFDHLNCLPVKFFDGRTHGEIMSRATNDVALVSQMMSRGLVSFFVSLLTLLCILAAMLFLSPRLTIAVLLPMPVFYVLTKAVARHIRAFFASQQTVLGLLNGHVEEILSAQKVVKSFNHETQAIEDFSSLNSEMLRISLWASIMSGSMPPVMGLINNLGYALLVGTGAYLVSNGSISIGVIATFIQYAHQFSRPAMEIANQYNDIQSALAGAERVFALMDAEPEDDSGADTLPQPVNGRLEFRNVNFSYKEGEPVLKEFNLIVEPGQKIALVGTTGAGKTTIASLLMRFYDVSSGDIFVDGKSIYSLKRDSLLSSISMVLQDTWLFNGTIRENIRYGRLESTDAEVEHAAKAIGADQFIRRLPNGYDTVIGDGGSSLSQGQRQLISIARAILKDAPVLILDEATSNVDTRTELIVQRAMLHLMEGRTCIVIAHRLSTIRDADSIIVLENGRIIEQGTREELMAA